MASIRIAHRLPGVVVAAGLAVAVITGNATAATASVPTNPATTLPATTGPGAPTTIALPPIPPSTAKVIATPITGLDPSYANNLSVSGTGFEDIPGGFSGIYVLFGWVGPGWRPSAGGVSGQDYIYVQDTQTKNNHGYIKFVSYSNGTTLSAANGGIITRAGTWKTTLVVPGATFPASGENGQITQINCLQVQCGVITIGAHGVVDPENETFTPVTFAATSAQAIPTTSTTVPSKDSAKTHPAKHPKAKKKAHPKTKAHRRPGSAAEGTGR